MTQLGAITRTAGAVLRRPTLWPTALRQVRRTTPPGWWRRAPFLPVPSRQYMRFRLVTQYGDAAHAMEPADVITYLTWCRRHDRAR